MNTITFEEVRRGGNFYSDLGSGEGVSLFKKLESEYTIIFSNNQQNPVNCIGLDGGYLAFCPYNLFVETEG